MSSYRIVGKKLIVWTAVFLLGAGVWLGCGDEGREQAVTEPAEQKPVAEQPQEQASDQATAEQTQGPESAQTQAGEKLIGKQVVSKDARVLGTVAELHPAGDDSGYVIIKGEDDRLHPVPANLLEEEADRNKLSTAFDQSTFQQSPSFSATEQQQLSDSQLQEVRGYYEDKTQGGGQMPSGQDSRYQTPQGTKNQ